MDDVFLCWAPVVRSFTRHSDSSQNQTFAAKGPFTGPFAAKQDACLQSLRLVAAFCLNRKTNPA